MSDKQRKVVEQAIEATQAVVDVCRGLMDGQGFVNLKDQRLKSTATRARGVNEAARKKSLDHFLIRPSGPIIDLMETLKALRQLALQKAVPDFADIMKQLKRIGELSESVGDQEIWFPVCWVQRFVEIAATTAILESNMPRLIVVLFGDMESSTTCTITDLRDKVAKRDSDALRETQRSIVQDSVKKMMMDRGKVKDISSSAFFSWCSLLQVRMQEAVDFVRDSLFGDVDLRCELAALLQLTFAGAHTSCLAILRRARTHSARASSHSA